MILPERIIRWIKNRFGIRSGKDWLYERAREVEAHCKNGDTLPFKIERLRNGGFLTRVNGLYSFISFYHMPWKYNAEDHWKAVAPYLTGKKFFCKIHKCDKDIFNIILNGQLPQFKKAKLIPGNEYRGVIIAFIKHYGMLIDIGFHFNWKCGSIVGMLHRSQLSEDVNVSDFELGQKITVIYQKAIDDDRHDFCQDWTKTDQAIEKLKELIGTTTWAKVIRRPDSNAVYLLINGKHRSLLKVNKRIYPSYRRRVMQKSDHLKDGDIINCEVIGFDERSNMLTVKWIVEFEDGIMLNNELQDNLPDDTVEKLQTLKDQMLMENN